MKKIIYILIVLLFIGGVAYVIFAPEKAGKYDDFAKCITDSGAKFYGTFWCPHCQAQKAKFGKSAKFLPYTECSTPDGQGQLQVCKDAGITAYPTWMFANATTSIVGDLEFSELAERTSCALPSNQ